MRYVKFEKGSYTVYKTAAEGDEKVVAGLMEERHGALENITVLDLGRVIAAPYCASVLADLGARVIKIEQPEKGDDSRLYGPFVNGESAYYANMNRNKEGITLNLRDPKGKEILKELVKKADVLIENFRPGVMKKLGLDYDVLKEVNPQLVYLEISGFGGYGRYSQRPGYDIIAQAMGGMMSVTGPKGGKPTRAGVAVGDIAAGINGALGILAALNARSLIGHGQKVDVAILDTIVSLMENNMIRYRYSGKVYERNGNTYPATALIDSFTAKDGDYVMACPNQNLFEKLCNKVTGHTEWLKDLRFETSIARGEHAAEIKQLVEEWSRQFTVDEIVNKCLEAGVPAGVVNDFSQIVKDPHIVEDREMFLECDHPVIGKQIVNGDAIKMSDTMPHVYRHAPLLSADTESVLGELGYTPDEVAKLREDKVV